MKSDASSVQLEYEGVGFEELRNSLQELQEKLIDVMVEQGDRMEQASQQMLEQGERMKQALQHQERQSSKQSSGRGFPTIMPQSGIPVVATPAPMPALQQEDLSSTNSTCEPQSKPTLIRAPSTHSQRVLGQLGPSCTSCSLGSKRSEDHRIFTSESSQNDPKISHWLSGQTRSQTMENLGRAKGTSSCWTAKGITGGFAACVKSRHFDHTVGAIIFLNAIFVFFQADYTARNPGKGNLQSLFSISETLFFAVFALELTLRLLVYRRSFFTGDEVRWNVFDCIVVITAAIEETVKQIAMDKFDSNLTFLRLMRIIKITRVVRIIRIVKVFRELRIMVMSIISTLRTLFWSIVCLLIIMSGFGVYLATAAADHQAKEGGDEEMAMYFGSMPKVMVSLFQATTGGIDWRILSDLLGRISEFTCIMMYGYVSMMVYAIMNILTGICVNNANKAADDDMELSRDLSQHNSAVSTLRKILTDETDGTITWMELQTHLSNSKIRGYFRKLDLEPWHLQSFFDLLQIGDTEPSVPIDQFIRGCLRLRCPVKNVDLMAALREERELDHKRFIDISSALDQLNAGAAAVGNGSMQAWI